MESTSTSDSKLPLDIIIPAVGGGLAVLGAASCIAAAIRRRLRKKKEVDPEDVLGDFDNAMGSSASVRSAASGAATSALLGGVGTPNPEKEFNLSISSRPNSAASGSAMFTGHW